MRDHRNTPIHFGDICLKNPFAIYAQIPANCKPGGKISTDTLTFVRNQSQRESSMVIVGPASMITPQNPKKPVIRADQPKYGDSLRAIAKVIESKGPLAGILILDDPSPINQTKWSQSFIATLGRLREAGFRYLELKLEPLHESWVTQELVQKALSQIGANESMLALSCEGISEQILHAFVEAGGHLVCFEGTAPKLPKEHLLKKLESWPKAEQIIEDLKGAQLIGIPGQPLRPQ